VGEYNGFIAKGKLFLSCLRHSFPGQVGRLGKECPDLDVFGNPRFPGQ